MKLQTIKRCCAMFVVNHILAGTHSYGLKRKLLRFAGYQVGEETRVVGPLFSTAKLKIGARCWIGRDFKAHGNGSVVIEDNCDIAPGVMFLTGGHEIGDEERRAGTGQHYAITVQKGAWIGARATITKDVTVGAGSVVAACACVARDVPKHTLCGGVPARTIRELKE